MNMRRGGGVARGAGEAFSIAAGALAIFFDILGGFIGVPGIFRWIFMGVAGLIAGCWGGFNAWRTQRANEARRCNLERQQRAFNEERHQLLELTQEMKKELDEVKHDLEGKQHSPEQIKARIQRTCTKFQEMQTGSIENKTKHRQKPTSRNDRFFSRRRKVIPVSAGSLHVPDLAYAAMNRNG